MAEIKKNFLQGNMELDLDDRLVPDGALRYGQNVTVARSSTADVGALENVRGNRQIPTEFPLSSSYVCLGSTADELNNKIYWFFVGPTTEGIYEYDVEADNVNRVLEFSRSRRIFNFNTNNFITGANVIGDFLTWTDNLNPPRLINIQRFVSRPEEVVTLAGVQTIQTGAGRYFTPNSNGGYFQERQFQQLIQENGNAGNPATTTGQTVIPLRNVPDAAEAITVTTVMVNEVAIEPDNFTLDVSGRTITLTNALTAGDFVRIVFEYSSQEASNPSAPTDTGARLLSTVDPEYDNNGVALVNLNIDDINIVHQPAFHGDLISVAKRPPLFAPIVNSPSRGNIDMGQARVIQAQDGDFLYDNFVYFAYRQTYRDGQVTPLSPFSPPAFFPRSYQEDRASGGIPSMVNRFSRALINYDVGDEEVTEIELVVYSARDNTLKSLATINKAQHGLRSSTPYQRVINTFEYDNNKVYATLPPSELFRLYDNVPLRAQAQEIVGNRLVYGNFVQNYNLTKIDGNPIVPSFNVSYDSMPTDADKTDAVCSVKSDRDYQVGIVYLDREGRQTPVLLSDAPGASSSVKVRFNDEDRPGLTHTNKNILTVDINSAAPTWATHYRFFIKQVQGDFYNVLPKNVAVSGGKVYLQLDSDDRNKINANTEFIIKGDGNGLRTQRSLWRIDPYITDASGDSAFSVTSDGQGGFNISSDAADAISFNIPYADVQERTGNSFGSLVPSNVEASLNTGSLSTQGTNPIITLPGFGASDNVNVVSITRADGTLLGRYQTTGYGAPNWVSRSGGQIYIRPGALDDNEAVTVTYTQLVSDPDSPARNDFYVSIVPVEPSDVGTLQNGDTNIVLETVPEQGSVADIYYEHGETFRCVNGSHTTSSVEVIRDNDVMQELYGAGETIPTGMAVGDPVTGVNGTIQVRLEKYFNCFTYPVGVEEQTIEGKFNNVSLLPGIKASTTNELYREREQISDLIHSGIFNDDTSLNRLNEFNPGLPISTEIDIADGSIQKLHSRDTNLIVFQEDKVKNVPIQKNLIQTADGSAGLSTSSRFFGTESAYAGEYGISRNPESFATYGNRIYFADKNRGALLRLGGDGITEISQQGAESYVRETIRQADLIVGSYDHFHDQAHFSFRNRPTALLLTPNELEISLSEDGRSGPRSECNRNQTLINFKRRFAYVSNIAMGIQSGDVIFVDANHTVQFNGDYRWYRIQDPSGTTPDRWNRAIQISPDGVVTGVESNCAANQPPDMARQIFNISDVGVPSEFEACAFSIVNGLAYHNGAGSDPVVGDIVYEGRFDRVRSTRTGWYTITGGADGLGRFVILLCNGEVMDVVDCEEISRDRNLILGSNPQDFLAGTQEAVIIDDVCTEPFAEQFYWFEGNGDLPGAGMTLYTSNHTDDTATASRYYTFPNGYYVQLDENSVIMPGFPRLCSERICFVNPNEVLQQQADQFQWQFQGVDRAYYFTTFGNTVETFDTTRSVRNAEIEYIVQGEQRYPRTGTFRVNQEIGTGASKRYAYDFRVTEENRYMRLAGDVVDPLTLGSNAADGTFTPETVTLPMPNDAVNLSENPYPEFANEDINNVRVIVTSLCYRIPVQTIVGANVVPATAPTAAITGPIVGETGGAAIRLSSAESDGGLFRGGAVAGISSRSWRVGGVEVSTAETYDLPAATADGTVTVTLIVNSANGLSDTTTHNVVFSTSPPETYTFSATVADNHANAVVVGTFASFQKTQGDDLPVPTRNLQVRPETGFEWTGSGNITISASPALPSAVTFSAITQPTAGTNGIVTSALGGSWNTDANYTGTFTFNIPAGAIRAIPAAQTPSTPAWIAPATDGTVCGMQTVSAVYYDATATTGEVGRQYFEDPGREIAFSSGAGLYGVADTEPVNGQAVVTRVQNINASGIVQSTGNFACVNNNPTYLISLGFTSTDTTTARQIACQQATNMVSTVEVYSDQPLTNFRDDPPTDPTNPGNPPTRFQTASGGHVADGWYTDGTNIRQVTNGVVGAKLAQGCSLELVARLSTTDDVTAPSGVAPIITLRTDQGTSVTHSTNPTTLSDVGEVGETWSFTTTIALPPADNVATNGYEWSDGPNVSIDGGTASAVASNGVVPWSGTFTNDHIASPPTQTQRFTGTIVASAIPPPPPTTYDATFTVSESIDNAALGSVIFDTAGHGWTRVGSTNTYTATGIPLAETGNISVDINTASNYIWGSNSPTVNGSFGGADSTTTHRATVSYDRNNTEPSIVFAGTTTFVPPPETYNLTGRAFSDAVGSATAANVTASNDTATISSGQVTLTSTLSANAGWQLVASTPGSTTQNEVFTFPTTDRNRNADWTNVRAERYAHTLTEVSSWAGSGQCPTGGTSVTVHTDSATIRDGNIYTGATSTTVDTSTRYFIDGTTVYTYDGAGGWTSASCDDEPPRTAVTYRQASSFDGACAVSTSTEVTLYQASDGTWYLGDVGDNRRPSTSNYYGIGFTVYTFNSGGTRDSGTRCPGVYINGQRRSSGSSAVAAAFGSTSATSRTEQVELVGVTATFTPSLSISAGGSVFHNTVSYSLSYDVGSTNGSASGMFPTSTRGVVPNIAFSPSAITVGPGVYNVNATATRTDGDSVFGTFTVTVTY